MDSQIPKVISLGDYNLRNILELLSYQSGIRTLQAHDRR